MQQIPVIKFSSATNWEFSDNTSLVINNVSKPHKKVLNHTDLRNIHF